MQQSGYFSFKSLTAFLPFSFDRDVKITSIPLSSLLHNYSARENPNPLLPPVINIFILSYIFL